MSEIKVNKISPATGTAFTLGDSGDTFTVPSGATLANSGTATGFGGTWTLIDTGSWTGVSTVDLGADLTGDYSTHVIYLDSYHSNSSSAQLYMKVKVGGTWYGGSDNDSTNHHSRSDGSTVGEYGATGSGEIRLTGDGYSLTSDRPGFWKIVYRNLLSSSLVPNYVWSAAMINHDSDTVAHHITGGGQTDQTGTVTDIQFLPSASTFHGNWELYGIKNA